MAKHHNWTNEQIQYLRENIEGTSYKDLHVMLNKEFGLNLTFNQTQGTLNRYGIRNGLGYHFKKGHATWDKGMKGLDTGGSAGWFKKGDKSFNYLPVGTERVDSDGYILVKVNPDGSRWEQWARKHRHVWEQVNGKVPDGHVIIFGDTDKRNFDIDNLILVNRKNLAYLNKLDMIQTDAELTRSSVEVIKLKHKINERMRELN